MEKGGNDELHAYFERYNLNEESVSAKYMTKAAQFYRKKLASLAAGDEQGLELLSSQGEPNYSEGRLSI